MAPSNSLKAPLPEEVASGQEFVRDVFVARQPIFDKRERVYAYELLFRSSFENVCKQIDRHQASGQVLSSAVLTFGLDALTSGKRAFVNLTGEHITEGSAQLLPAETAVIEILEDVEPSPALVQACRELRRLGYTIALDDFVYHERLEPLVDLAQIVKVSFRDSTLADRDALAKRLLPRGIELLAEQVETREELDEAVRLGYTYFQGFFFHRPEVIKAKELTGFKLTYMQILQAVHKPELNYDELEDIIRRDVSMSHKLLRYINSAWFGFRMPIESIRHALVLIGENDVRRWVSLMSLGGLGQNKARELLISSAIRARFCESLASDLGIADRAFDLFLLGAFSLIDAIVDRPMEAVLREMPVAGEVRAALMGEQNRLWNVLDLTVRYENGDWPAFSTRAAHLGLPEHGIPPRYLEALTWSREAFGP